MCFSVCLSVCAYHSVCLCEGVGGCVLDENECVRVVVVSTDVTLLWAVLRVLARRCVQPLSSLKESLQLTLSRHQTDGRSSADTMLFIRNEKQGIY